MIKRAFSVGVRYMLLPNINSDSLPGLLNLHSKYPKNIFPMIGLHPTNVKADWEEEIGYLMKQFEANKFYAIGETGIDLYWDKTFIEKQKASLQFQIDLAKTSQLPIVLHIRDSFDEVFEVLNKNADQQLTGVFHCFTGNLEQAERAIELGFMLGIGGVLTYKNSGLDKVVATIDMSHLLLETDSPYLAPNPYRGKRNESAYVRFIAARLAEIKGLTVAEVANITTENAIRLFKLPLS
jgi:TatD DNase family protein